MSKPTSKMVDAKTQAEWFGRVRRAHQTETAEDYLELIADLIDMQNEARLSDLAQRLGVSHATASKVLNRLKDEGFIDTQPYRAIFLTEKGSQLAEQSRQRHEIVEEFLRALGVPEKIAQVDAEGIEHHVSPETLAAFQRFTANRK